MDPKRSSIHHSLLLKEIMATSFKNNFVVGVTAGLVAAVIAPMLFPAIKRGSRPMAKNLIKGGMLLYEKGREVAASAGEIIEDVMAEIDAEAGEGATDDEPEEDAADNEHGTGLSSIKHPLRPKEQGTGTS